jgi:hypothetical protein
MMKKLMSVMLLTLTALGADAALAGATSPLTVGGTWTVVANRGRLVLRIHPHANASACTAITGILDGADPIHGFYRSSTGRIHFLRSDVSNQPTQSWLGSVSNDGPGAVPVSMAGTFVVSDTTGGAFGEYNFTAIR